MKTKPYGTLHTGRTIGVLFVLAFMSLGPVSLAAEPGAEPIANDSAVQGRAEVTLVQHGQAKATIITAANPTPAAHLAALELQTHIRKITGAVLPMKTDRSEIAGTRILVGESAATRKLGLRGAHFASQAYLIQFLPDTVVLMG